MEEKYALNEMEKSLDHLVSTEAGRRAFLMAMPILLASCASKSKHRNREGDNTGQSTSISVLDERKMTKEYLPKMRKEYPPINNAEVQNYINRVGQKIVRSNNLNAKPYRYTFTVAHSKMVNAFALPAGSVFVTAPLIALADSEAELAGVVGHEIGHIKARHTAERIDAANNSKGKSLLYGLGGALLGGATGFGLGKLLCRKQDRDCMRRIATYGAMAGGAGGLLIQKFAFMANSREDEMEADRIGFRTSYQAGYHKDHVGKFYSKLLDMEQKHKGKQAGFKKSFADALSTHPPSKERVNQMNQMANSVPIRNNMVVSSKEFDRVKQILRRYKS